MTENVQLELFPGILLTYQVTGCRVLADRNDNAKRRTEMGTQEIARLNDEAKKLVALGWRAEAWGLLTEEFPDATSEQKLCAILKATAK